MTSTPLFTAAECKRYSDLAFVAAELAVESGDLEAHRHYCVIASIWALRAHMAAAFEKMERLAAPK